MEFPGSVNVCIAAVVAYVIYYLATKITRYRKWVNISKQVTTIGSFHPIWGSLHLFSDYDGYLRLCKSTVQRTRAKIIHVWVMFFYPAFTVCHPDTAKLLMKSSEPKPKVNGSYRLIMPWIGDGLLLSGGKKWERNRRLLTPAFHFDILRPYVQEYNQVADIFLSKLQNAVDKNEAVEISNLVTLATLDTMMRCALSYDDKVQEMGFQHPYVVAVKRLSTLMLERAIKPWLYPDFIYYLAPSGREFKKLCDYVHDFADKIIATRKQAIAKDPNILTKRRLDFLDILITVRDESGKGLSDTDMRAEVDTFLFEGHDTTASAISWAIYALGKYPNEQEKLYQEVKGIMGNKPYVEWKDLPNLKKQVLFLKETMRMFSPVPLIGRTLTKETEFDGVKIPVDFPVEISLYLLNHHPDVWPDHDVFRPERFEEKTFTDRDPFHYVPFSAGPRNCIGQNFAMNEMKVLISRLLMRFKIHLLDDHVYEISPDVVMRSQNGIKVKLENR